MCLMFRYVVRGHVLGVLHLVAEDEEVIFDIAETVWWRLTLGCVSDRGHGVAISLASGTMVVSLRKTGVILSTSDIEGGGARLYHSRQPGRPGRGN